MTSRHPSYKTLRLQNLFRNILATFIETALFSRCIKIVLTKVLQNCSQIDFKGIRGKRRKIVILYLSPIGAAKASRTNISTLSPVRDFRKETISPISLSVSPKG
jgi:hypothetical protein